MEKCESHKNCKGCAFWFPENTLSTVGMCRVEREFKYFNNCCVEWHNRDPHPVLDHIMG